RGSHDAGKDENARPATNRPRGGILSQVAKLTVVVGTEVVFQQAPAFAGYECPLQLVRMKSKSRLLCGCGLVQPSGGRLSCFPRSLLLCRHVRSIVCLKIPLTYSPPRRGGVAQQLNKAGAPGAKREPDRAKPELVVSSAKSGTRWSSMR